MCLKQQKVHTASLPFSHAIKCVYSSLKSHNSTPCVEKCEKGCVEVDNFIWWDSRLYYVLTFMCSRSYLVVCCDVPNFACLLERLYFPSKDSEQYEICSLKIGHQSPYRLCDWGLLLKEWWLQTLANYCWLDIQCSCAAYEKKHGFTVRSPFAVL